MPLGFNLGYLITAAMVLVAAFGAFRWRRLDRGGRWLVVAVAVSAAFIPFSLWLVFAGALHGYHTEQLQQVILYHIF